MKIGAFALALLSATLCASATSAEKPEVKRHTALTAPLPLTQGEVTNTFHRLPIPKGPIAVYRFEADVVEKDADGNVIPVGNYDAYLHHHVVGSVHKHYAESADKWTPMKPVNFSRSVGFGAGTESRGTPQEFKYPYAFMTVEGEDEWVANVHIINTRKMSSANAHHCLECPCTSKDVFTENAVNGREFVAESCNADLRFENNTVCSAATYHGGLRCCEDSEFCLEKEDLAVESETSTYYLRYTIEYSEVVPENRPLYLAGCCDASGDESHHGNVEYDIPVCNPEIHPGCVHTLSTRQSLDLGQSSVYRFMQDDQNFEDREVELVYAVGHQHRGGLGIQMFDEKSGDLLCSSVPSYGNGAEVGNENGYVVSISTCTLDPPRRMRASDIVRLVALYNNTEAHTGVMSLMYLALADVVAPTESAVVSNAAVTGAVEESHNLVLRFLKSPFMVIGPTVAAVGCVIIFVLHMKKRHGYHELSNQDSL
jgi:hypothetical protein